MSFSATWGTGDSDVCQPDAATDLVIEKAVLSPPLDQLADDVKDEVHAVAEAAVILVQAAKPSPSGLYTVTASGHVRQGENDSGYVSLSIAEKTDAA